MKLRRVLSSDKGTYGVLIVDGLPFGVTMELPNRGNQVGISCIPSGNYKWKKHISPSKGEVIWIHDVPGRTWIYIHVANWPSEVRGCVGVGYKFSPSPKDEFGVIESGNAMKDLLNSLPKEGTIEVVDA